jgi:mRNA-degrading endonuclease RelE of RelBE toxin-antitoxin system
MNSKRKGYKVEATPSFRRMLKKLSREAQHRTLERLKELETRPHSF